MTARTTRLLAGLPLLAALAMAGPAAGADTIKVGGLAPLSSPGAYQQGKELVLGLQWAVDDFNAAGGLDGKMVELLVEDTQGKPPVGATAAEKLITSEGVVGLAGEYHSSVCSAEIEVAKQHGKPFVIASCWSDNLTEAGYAEVFRTSVYSSKLAENMVGLAAEAGLKKVAAIVEDSDYGVGIAKNIEGVIAKLGVDIDFSYEVVEKTGKDFVPVLLKYKTQVKPEMIISAVTQPGGFLVLKQAHEIGFAPSSDTLFLDATCTSQNDVVFWEAVKGAGKNVLLSCPFSPSVKLTPLGETIKARYIKEFDREPNYVVLQGYDSMQALLEGMKAAGSTEGPKIVEALKTLAFDGSRGPVKFETGPGVWTQQWKDVPTFIFQYTEVDQAAGDASVLYPPAFKTADIQK
jgi:branched-chain amino acid transport system substrate-binding protein